MLAIVIGCSDSDLISSIDSNWSERVGFESVLSLNFSRVAIDQMAKYHRCIWARGQDNSKNGSSSDAAIDTMTWEHGDYLLMPPQIAPSDW